MGKLTTTVLTGNMLLCTLLFCAGNKVSGQDQSQYMKSMNSIVPGTPEASSIMRSIDFPISPFTGQPNISIPVCEVKGKSLSVPISLSYTATSGIRINEMAGKTGLGWLLSAGGEITREVRGKPDEGCCGAIGLFNTSNGSYQTYKNEIMNNTPAGFNYMQNAAKGFLDLEPDMFYFSMAGLSGKFIYDISTGSFICTQLEPYKVTYSNTANNWTIIDPEGNIYLFDDRVRTTTRQYCNYVSPVGSGDQITTSWKLTKILNADKTDSILITYESNSYTYFTEGSSIKYQLVPQQLTTPRPPMNCFNEDYISGKEQISKICSIKDTVVFQYAYSQREDLLGQQRAIEKILYSNGEPSAKAIFKLDYDYYSRYPVSGINSPQIYTDDKKSLRLNQLTNFGNSESNANPLKWIFTYNPRPLPQRLSYIQDFWGYYNNNSVTNTLVPREVWPYVNGIPVYSDGADRFTDTTNIKAGILEKIQFPTGGTITFDYESNTTAVPTEMAKPVDMLSIANTIVQGDAPPAAPYDNETKYFTVNVEDNPELNLSDGVLANVTIMPTTPHTPGGPTWVAGYPYFELSKTAELDNTPLGTHGNYSRFFSQDAVTSDHLPNGKYTMTVHINGYHGNPGNNQLPPGDGGMATLGLVFSVNYYIPDTSKFINYQLGGLRVRSITSKDQYSNTTNTKIYKYNNPETDSSYGFFTGSTIHMNKDYLKKYTQSTGNPQAGWCDYFLFYARHGNSIMPGYNSLGASVVYPKVIEYTVDGNSSYKTEYNYAYVSPLYPTEFPLTPPALNEAKHGKLLSSTAFKTVGTTFQDAKTTENIYDFNPYCEYCGFSEPLGKVIPGIRTAFAGYSDQGALDHCGFFDHAFANLYGTIVQRADLKSDTTITYDLNNPYNGIKEWHDYAYGDYTQQPIVIRTGNSDGSVSVQKNYLAKDQPEQNPDIYTNPSLPGDMVLKNRVTIPLGTKQFKDNQLLSRQVTNAHFDVNGNKLLIDNMQQALLNNPLETEISVLEYDDAANPLSIKMRGDKYRKYIWNTAKSTPLATCVMANNDRFVFTSFEYPNEYSWNENSRVQTGPFSGKYAYKLAGGNIVLPPFSNITHGSVEVDAYVWATGATFSINGYTPESTGKTKGSYTLYHKRLVTANLFTLSSADVSLLVDQVVIIPVGSHFQGNVYDAGNRITAIVNDQIMTSFFEYDNFGRLSSVRDEQGNIIKSSSYQYQGPQ